MGPTIKLFAVSLASVIYVSSDITILGIFRGNKDVGIYTIASRVDSTIKTVLNAVMTVAMPRLSFYLGHQEEDQFNGLLHNIFDYLITFALPVICGLFMLSGPIMYLLGGQEYVQGYLSLQILSISLFFAVLACYFATGIILLYKMDNVYLVATIISSATNIALNFLLIPYLGYNGAALTTLLAEMIMMGITAYYSLKIPNIANNKKSIFGDRGVIISSLIGSIGIVITCMALKLVISSQIVIIIASVILSVVVYACILKLCHNPIYDYVINSLKAKILK
jgi:O-antigen/teichoic acid export membrane protein